MTGSAIITSGSGSLSLPDLATAIDREHAHATDAASTAIEHARECGELLRSAKEKVGHGGFLAWLEKNCHVGDRQARRYMRLAAHWSSIEQFKTDPRVQFGLKTAMRLLLEYAGVEHDAVEWRIETEPAVVDDIRERAEEARKLLWRDALDMGGCHD